MKRAPFPPHAEEPGLELESGLVLELRVALVLGVELVLEVVAEEPGLLLALVLVLVRVVPPVATLFVGLELPG